MDYHLRSNSGRNRILNNFWIQLRTTFFMPHGGRVCQDNNKPKKSLSGGIFWTKILLSTTLIQILRPEGWIQIQEYLTAAIQNIMILLKDVKEPAAALQMRWRQRLLSRPVEQRPASCLIYLTRWWAIAHDFVALWCNLSPYHPTQIIGWAGIKSTLENKKYSSEFSFTKYRFRQQPVKLWPSILCE